MKQGVLANEDHSGPRADSDAPIGMMYAPSDWLAFEFTLPLTQDLNGPQLESDWMVTTGYQYSF